MESILFAAMLEVWMQPGTINTYRLVNMVAEHGKYALAKQPHYMCLGWYDLTDGSTFQNCNAQKEIYTLFSLYIWIHLL